MAMSTGGKAQINVTPMIDVLLVLIIIFMVLTPITPRGLNVLVPQSGGRPSEPAQDIVVTVHAGGGISLNQQPVAVSDLHDRLAALFRNHNSHVIFVQGDKDLDFQPVAQVIDIARGVGLDRVALMTQEVPLGPRPY